jgi:cytochrome c-type biogenesis protein CcsB
LGYASFAVSFGISILYIIRDKKEDQKEGVLKWLPATPVLDEINYKSIVIGFPMLTLGIITGAAWANYAWGSYWSWDPKETWSLITWFIYAAFLHARFTRDWKGKRTAILSIVGFIFVLFTYFGVNYLISGLHSYL